MLRTREQVEASRVAYVQFDKNSGNFTIKSNGNTNEYAEIEGRFIGISQHDFNFQGKSIPKLVFHVEDEREYQLSFGLKTWITLGLLNSLASAKEVLAYDKKITFGIRKDKTDNLVFNLKFDGKPLKWAYNFEDLKITGTPEEKEAQRNRIIERWLNGNGEKKGFLQDFPYSPTASYPEVDDEPIVNSLPVDKDELPF